MEKIVSFNFLDGAANNNLVGALARAMKPGDVGQHEQKPKVMLWLLSGLQGKVFPWEVFEALRSTSTTGKPNLHRLFEPLQARLEADNDLYEKCKEVLSQVDKNGSGLEVAIRLQEALRALAKDFEEEEPSVDGAAKEHPPGHLEIELGDAELAPEPVPCTEILERVLDLCREEDRAYVADNIEKLLVHGADFVLKKAIQVDMGVIMNGEGEDQLEGDASTWLAKVSFMILAMSITTCRGLQDGIQELRTPKTNPRQMLRAFVEIVGEIPFPFDVLENMDLGTQEALDEYAPMVTQAYKIYYNDEGEDETNPPMAKKQKVLETMGLEEALVAFAENSSGGSKDSLGTTNPTAMAKKHKKRISEVVVEAQGEGGTVPLATYNEILVGHEKLTSGEANAAMMVMMGMAKDGEYLTAEMRKLQMLPAALLERTFKDPMKVEAEWEFFRTEPSCKEVPKRALGDPGQRFDMLLHYFMQGNWQDVSFVGIYLAAVASSKNTDELYDEEQQPIITKMARIRKDKTVVSNVFGARDGTGGEAHTIHFAELGFKHVFTPAVKELLHESVATVLIKTIQRFFNILKKQREWGHGLFQYWRDFMRVMSECHKNRFKDNSMMTTEGRLDFPGVEKALEEVQAGLTGAEAIMKQDMARKRLESPGKVLSNTQAGNPQYKADGGCGPAPPRQPRSHDAPPPKKQKFGNRPNGETYPNLQGGGGGHRPGQSGQVRVSLNTSQWVKDFGPKLCGHNFCKKGGCGVQSAYDKSDGKEGAPCRFSHDAREFQEARKNLEKTGKHFNSDAYLRQHGGQSS